MSTTAKSPWKTNQSPEVQPSLADLMSEELAIELQQQEEERQLEYLRQGFNCLY